MVWAVSALTVSHSLFCVVEIHLPFCVFYERNELEYVIGEQGKNDGRTVYDINL